MELETLTNDSMIVIWNDIKEFGTAFWVFVFIINLLVLKDQWISIFKYVFDKIMKKKSVKSYTKKDLLNHPIFHNLDYWLSQGVEILHIKDNIHPDENEYISNKEKMAKEVIKIKYTVMKETLKNFVTNNDVEYLSPEVAGELLIDDLLKGVLTQKRKLLERGVPLVFLNKYYAITDMNNKVIYTALRNYFSQYCDSSTINKLYMAFNTLDGYLNVIFSDLCEAINTINGDLKNEIFDGKLMGTPKITSLKPPSASNYFVVKEMLDSALKEFNGSRAMINKYFTKDGEIYHSVIYESTIVGITSEKDKIQMIPNETNIYAILKSEGVIIADIGKFDATTIARLNARGVKAIIIAPIWDNDEISGTLSIEYISHEKFDTITGRDIDEEIEKIAQSFAEYIRYPEGYKF